MCQGATLRKLYGSVEGRYHHDVVFLSRAPTGHAMTIYPVDGPVTMGKLAGRAQGNRMSEDIQAEIQRLQRLADETRGVPAEDQPKHYPMGSLTGAELVSDPCWNVALVLDPTPAGRPGGMARGVQHLSDMTAIWASIGRGSAVEKTTSTPPGLPAGVGSRTVAPPPAPPPVAPPAVERGSGTHGSAAATTMTPAARDETDVHPKRTDKEVAQTLTWLSDQLLTPVWRKPYDQSYAHASRFKKLRLRMRITDAYLNCAGTTPLSKTTVRLLEWARKVGFDVNLDRRSSTRRQIGSSSRVVAACALSRLRMYVQANRYHDDWHTHSADDWASHHRGEPLARSERK